MVLIRLVNTNLSLYIRIKLTPTTFNVEKWLCHNNILIYQFTFYCFYQSYFYLLINKYILIIQDVIHWYNFWFYLDIKPSFNLWCLYYCYKIILFQWISEDVVRNNETGQNQVLLAFFKINNVLCKFITKIARRINKNF